MPRIIGQFNNYKNYKSKLATFLIGQAIVGGAWSTFINIDGSVTTQHTDPNNHNPYQIISTSWGGTFNNNAELNVQGQQGAAILGIRSIAVAGISNYTINVNAAMSTDSELSSPIITILAINPDPGIVTITNTAKIFHSLDNSNAEITSPGPSTAIKFAGSKSSLHFIQNNTNSYVNGDIIGSAAGDVITLNEGKIKGNIIFGDGVNQLNLKNASQVLGTGVAITGGAGGNTINISGTSTLQAGGGSYAISIPASTSGGTTVKPSTINISGTPTITGGISATAVDNVLNIGTADTNTLYATGGDITNMQTINVSSAPGTSGAGLTFVINNNVTGVKSFTNNLNAGTIIQNHASIAGVSSSGPGSDATAALTNNGSLYVVAGGSIAGLTIANNSTIDTAGTINAPINCATTSKLVIRGGSILKKITGSAGINTIDIYDPFTTSADIDKIDTLNVNANSILTINNKITGVDTKFNNVVNSSVTNISSGGDLSGKGLITNNGTIHLTNDGTIGATEAMGNVTNNGGIINAGGGDVKIGTFTNVNDYLLQAQLKITYGSVQAGDINNTFGTIDISAAGDLSSIVASAPSSLINAAGQTINISGGGTVGAVNPLGNVSNAGTINAGGGDVKIGKFNNNQANAKLNITQGSVQSGDINNLGEITISNFGDLSSIDSGTGSTLTNAADQEIYVSGHGTIGSVNPLGTVNNYGTIKLAGNFAKIITLTNKSDAAKVIIANNNSLQVDNFNNEQGEIQLGDPTGPGDISSLDSNQSGKFTNAANSTITIKTDSSLGRENALANITNFGVIEANGGNIKAIEFDNNNKNSSLNIDNGSIVRVSSLNNKLGEINIGGSINASETGDLSSIENVAATLNNAERQTINVNKYGSIGANYPFGLITNNKGVFNIEAGASINASKIVQSGNGMTTAGDINAPIVFDNVDSILNILGGTTQSISGAPDAAAGVTSTVNITGPFATNGDIQNINNINLLANNLIINNNITGDKTKFTTALGTTTNITENAELSFGGEIDNAGIITAAGGTVAVNTFNNNAPGSELNISSGQVRVSTLVNTRGSVNISGGDLSALVNDTTPTTTPIHTALTNAADQMITVSENGTIGAETPFAIVENYGVINVQDEAVVKIDHLINNTVKKNITHPAQLNISGGTVLVNNIDNTVGNIKISSTIDHAGDLSSLDAKNPTTVINAAYQTITLSDNGTIGNTCALGAITNNGTINAGGGNVIVGDLQNGNIDNNYKASVNITKGTVKTGNIINNLGTIKVYSSLDAYSNKYVGDLSSADPLKPSSLTNAANQIIEVKTGTMGANNPLGVINNNGIMNIDNDITVGKINLGSAIDGILTQALGSLNLTGGQAKTGNIVNTMGNITIGRESGEAVDLSSVDSSNPSTITNGPGQTITLMGTGTIGNYEPLGSVINSGTINAGGGNISIGDFNNTGSSVAALNISSGNVAAKNIINAIGKIIISGGDLSSIDSTNHSNLTNSTNQTITILKTGTLGSAANCPIGTVTNNSVFQAYGGNITVDIFNNGSINNTASLDINMLNKTIKAGAISNINGSITIKNGDLSGLVVHSNSLTNAANQIITVSGTGTIGNTVALGTVNNNGVINAGGGDIKIGDFINNASNAMLNISKGNIQTGDINNILGKIILGANSTGGDLSGSVADTSALTNATNQIIDISGNATVGNNQALGSVTNDGVINAVTNIFKVGDFSNSNNGVVNIVNNNPLNTNQGISIKSIENSGKFTIDNPNNNGTPMSDIKINKFNNLVGGVFNINGKFTASGNCINNAGATTNIQADFDIGTGNTFTNQGTVNVLAPTTIAHGNYHLDTTGTHLLTIANGVPSTLTLTTGKASLAAGSIININIVDDSTLYDQQQLKIIDTTQTLNVAANTNNIINNINIVGQTGLLSFQLSRLDNKHLVAVVNKKSIASIIDPNNKVDNTLAATIDSVINNKVNDSMLNSAINKLTKLSQEDIKDAVHQLAPDTDIAGITLATNGVIVPEVISQRMDIVARSSITNLRTGYAAGGMQIDDGLWIKGLGGSIAQKKRADSAGYNANTVGFAFGADTKILNNTWIGLGLSSVGTHMKSKDSPAKKTNVRSYQMTVYGSFSPDNYYIDAFGAIAVNNYKISRNIQYVDQIATATFKGIQPSTKIAAGYNFYQKNGFKIIPNVSLLYSTLYQNPYSETGAGGIGLEKVSSTNLSQLELGAGVKLAVMDDEYTDQAYNPEIHFMVLHDLQASAQETTAKFIGGGGSFKIQGATPDKTTYNIGAGMVFVHKHSLHFTVNYDLRKKNKFIGHSGSLAVRYEL